MSSYVIDKLQPYKTHEQVMLLCSRNQLEEDESAYVQQLLKQQDMDWASFLGLILYHRVNGVVYRKLRGMNGIPWRIHFYLRAVYEEMVQRTVLHQQEIRRIDEVLYENGVRYAFMKGAVLNVLYYEKGERISGDSDLMVDVKDLDLCCQLMRDLGYRQGKLEHGVFMPATKKELFFARMNTYEIVPFLKAIDERYLAYHAVDINFRLSNDDGNEAASQMLSDVVRLEIGGAKIQTLSVERFLIFLCIHHYREATMIYKIANGEDMVLYKYMDIHMFIRKSPVDWDRLVSVCAEMNRKKEVYHTLSYTELLYPGTVDSGVFDMLGMDDVSFLHQYKGRDNSDEVYDWNMGFYERMFSPERKREAWNNIEAESNRFDRIQQELKK